MNRFPSFIPSVTNMQMLMAGQKCRALRVLTGGSLAVRLAIPLTICFFGCSPRPALPFTSNSESVTSTGAGVAAPETPGPRSVLPTPVSGTAVDPVTPLPPVSPAPVSVQPNWQRLLVCDQGRTWVDVDLNERRNIQVVSRDLAANQYLAGQYVIMTSETADLSQVTFQLHQDTGIFKISDFNVASSQESVTLKTPVLIGTDYMTQYSVVSRAFRDANSGGLKLEFVRATMQICNFYDAETATCSGNLTYAVRDRYIGSWYFSSCLAVGQSFESPL